MGKWLMYQWQLACKLLTNRSLKLPIETTHFRSHMYTVIWGTSFYLANKCNLCFHDIPSNHINQTWALITRDHKQLPRGPLVEPLSTSLCHQLSLVILPSSAFIAIFASQNPFPNPTGIMNPRLVLKSWNSRGLKILKLQSQYHKILLSM